MQDIPHRLIGLHNQLVDCMREHGWEVLDPEDANAPTKALGRLIGAHRRELLTEGQQDLLRLGAEVLLGSRATISPV